MSILSTREFLDVVFPRPESFIHILGRLGKVSRCAYNTDDRDEIARLAEKWSDKGLSVYYCMAAFEDDNGSVKSFKRKERLVLDPRQFVVLDIDFKEQGEQWQGTRAVLKFFRDNHGKPNIVVESGGGTHLYYKTDPADVLGYQEAFKQQYKSRDGALPCIDIRACIAANDVIRLPGTVHPIHNKPVRAHHFHDDVTLEEITPVARAKKTISKIPVGVVSQRYNKITDESVKHSMSDIIAGCAALQHFHDDALNNNWTDSDKMHRNGIAFIHMAYKHSADGTMDDAIKVMETHPNFVQVDHETIFETFEGPLGCEYMEDSGYDSGCATCPVKTSNMKHNPLNAATIMFSRKASKKPPKSPATPAPPISTQVPLPHKLQTPEGDYTLDDEGWWFQPEEKPGKGGKSYWPPRVHVTTTPIKFYTVQYRPTPDSDGHCVAVNLDTGLLQANIPCNPGATMMMTSLTRNGFCAVHSEGALKAFIRAHTNWDPPQDAKLGWSKSLRQFNLGMRLVLPNGKLEPNLMQITDLPVQAENGDASLWWDSINAHYFKYPEMSSHAEMIIASFVAPLFRLLRPGLAIKGYTLILNGNMNCGKTSALHHARSVWGDYSDISPDASVASVNYRLGHLNNIPVLFDDMARGTSDNPNHVSTASLVHQVTEGMVPGRAKADGEPRASVYYSTMVLGTTNTSIREMGSQGSNSRNAAQAQASRWAERDVFDLSQILKNKYGFDVRTSDRSVSVVCNDNSGAAGLEYIQYLLGADLNLLQQRLATYVDHNNKICERHLSNFMALKRLAIDILRDMGRLDITDDMATLIARDSVDKSTADMEDIMEQGKSVVLSPEHIIGSASNTMIHLTVEAGVLQESHGSGTTRYADNGMPQVWKIPEDELTAAQLPKRWMKGTGDLYIATRSLKTLAKQLQLKGAISTLIENMSAEYDLTQVSLNKLKLPIGKNYISDRKVLVWRQP